MPTFIFTNIIFRFLESFLLIKISKHQVGLDLSTLIVPTIINNGARELTLIVL